MFKKTKHLQSKGSQKANGSYGKLNARPKQMKQTTNKGKARPQKKQMTVKTPTQKKTQTGAKPAQKFQERVRTPEQIMTMRIRKATRG